MQAEENVIGKTLAQVLPKRFFAEGHETTKAYTCINAQIVNVHTEEEWPGRHRRVRIWYVLDNKRAVGINQGRNSETTFPVIKWRER